MVNGIDISSLDKSFKDKVIEIMQRKNLANKEVYDNYYMDCKGFSKMMCTKDYKPHKGTAMALCLMLKLNLDEANDLMGRAGFVLSSSSLSDTIVKVFIVKGHYNLMDVDTLLFKNGCPQLKGIK